MGTNLNAGVPFYGIVAAAEDVTVIRAPLMIQIDHLHILKAVKSDENFGHM